MKFTHLYWLSSAVIARDGNKIQKSISNWKYLCFAYKFLHAIDSKTANVSIWWLSPSVLFTKSNIVSLTINIYKENNNNLKRKSEKNRWLTKKPRKLIWWQTKEMYKLQTTLFYIDYNRCLKFCNHNFSYAIVILKWILP